MSTARKAYLTVVTEGDAHGEDASATNTELVRALGARDPRAAVLAWRRHSPKIFRIVQRTLGSNGDAEDLTQDIFLRVFSRIGTLRDPEAFSSFVLSIALRMIKHHLRYRNVRKILMGVPEVPDTPVPGLDLDARRTLRRFYEILDTLPADERLVFALRHIEGMTLAEVASASGVSLATAKRRLQRASARLAKKALQDPALARYSSRMTRDAD